MFELSTMPGAIFDLDAWAALLCDADAVVVVLDSQVTRMAANIESMAHLATFGRQPNAVIYTKVDLVSDFVPPAWGTVHVSLARDDQPETLVGPIKAVLNELGDP